MRDLSESVSVRVTTEEKRLWRLACRARRVEQQALGRAFVQWATEQEDLAEPHPVFTELVERALALQFGTD